jgi:hypothetical protein
MSELKTKRCLQCGHTYFKDLGCKTRYCQKHAIFLEMLSMLKRLAAISTMDEAWDAELQDLIVKVEDWK